MEVRNETDSALFPLIVKIEGQKKKVERRTEAGRKDWVGKWDRQRLMEFERKLKERSKDFEKEGGVNYRWERLKKIIGEEKRIWKKYNVERAGGMRSVKGVRKN